MQVRNKALRWRRLRRAAALFAPDLRRHGGILALALGCGLAATLMQVLKPWPLKILFDGVLIPGGESPGLAWLSGVPVGRVVLFACLGLLAISVLWGLFSYAQAYLTARAGQEVVYALRQRAYAHLQRLSLGFHQKRQRGDLLMRLTGDINVLRDMLVDAVLMAVTAASMLIVMAGVMLAMDWRLALAALLVLPPLALTSFRYSVRLREATRKQRRNEGRVAGQISEMLAGITWIQASGSARHLDRTFKRRNRSSHRAGLRATRLEASQSRAIEILLAAGTAAVLGYGVMRVQAGALTPGDLLVFVSYVHSAFRPMRRLARVSVRLSKAVVCAERLVEVLTTPQEVRDRPGAKRLRRAEGALELRRVSFHYRAGVAVLRDVSFQVPAGAFVGVAGPSGVGKSTLLALMLRLYDPPRGKVLLDGRDVRRYRVESLREQVAVVLQEPLLFGASIRENIAFGRPEADDEQVQRAAELADAHRFICELPEGYDTPVAEAGASLSGGQRQRLAIARAFLRDAPVLLLDEPTHGLDAAAESEVRAALQRLMRGRTTVLIAHRLAALREADEILVLRRGRLRERGPFDELTRADGWFARAWSLQNRGSAPLRDLEAG